jgi:hypothetical protein
MSLQALILNNVEVMGYNHQNNFFGEKSFYYSSTKTISIRGYVLDLTNSIGVRDIYTDINRIEEITQDFHVININGYNLGVGKFTSLSFDEGNWVRSTQFDATIEITSSDSLESLTSEDFDSSYYIVSGGSSPNPNLIDLKFYKTNLISNNRPVYVDSTNKYLLRSVGSIWTIVSIQDPLLNISDNIVTGNISRRFETISSAQTPPSVTYTGVNGFTGSINLTLVSRTIDIATKRFDLIKNFSETFDVDFDQNNRIVGGTHSIDIEYTADNRNLSVIALAQSLASELLSNTIPANLIEGNYGLRPEGSYKTLHSESYDVINGKCGFTQRFSYSNGNNDIENNYSLLRNLNIALETNGIATVQENCNIKAENDNPSLYDNALIGLNNEMSGVYLRCSGLFSTYAQKFNLSGLLNRTMAQRNVRINKFDGTIDYDVSFNNDKKYTQPYIFDYTQTLDRGENYIYTVTEQGSILGIGEKKNIGNSNTKYITAESGWNVIKTGIALRSSGFWQLNAEDKASNQLNLINRNITRSPFQGQITYNYKYTDDPSIRNDLGDIKKLSIEYTDDSQAGNNPLPIYKEFIIPNNGYILLQNRNLKKQGTFSISAQAEIALQNQNSVFNGLNYFNTITGQVRNLYSGGNIDKYLESASFSSDEINQTISYQEVYKYS